MLVAEHRKTAEPDRVSASTEVVGFMPTVSYMRPTRIFPGTSTSMVMEKTLAA